MRARRLDSTRPEIGLAKRHPLAARVALIALDAFPMLRPWPLMLTNSAPM